MRRVARAGGMVAGGAVALLGAELAWVIGRDLPSFEGRDASGVRPAPDGPLHPTVRLLALGDSTLTGPGLDDVRDIWLWQALEAIDPPVSVEVRSRAVGGARVADVRLALDGALAEDVDLVVLAVGSNDAIRGTARRAFARDLDAVIARLARRVPVVAVANVGDLGNLERVPDPLARVLGARARIVRREIEAAVRRHPGVVLLDVAASDPDFRQGGTFVADRFHPNTAGHGLWARCAVPGLAAALADAAASAARRA